jgi:hypothetical protein
MLTLEDLENKKIAEEAFTKLQKSFAKQFTFHKYGNCVLTSDKLLLLEESVANEALATSFLFIDPDLDNENEQKFKTIEVLTYKELLSDIEKCWESAFTEENKEQNEFINVLQRQEKLFNLIAETINKRFNTNKLLLKKFIKVLYSTATESGQIIENITDVQDLYFEKIKNLESINLYYHLSLYSLYISKKKSL